MSKLPFDELLHRTAQHTVVDSERLQSLANLAVMMNSQHVKGDIVECGVARGGSAAVLAWASERHCWFYDSCQGLPEPTAVDGDVAWDYVGANQTSPAIITEALTLAQIDPSQYTIRPGWFADTFKQPGPTKIAMIHIDADWYQSVKLCLTKWYDYISPGGVIVLDDYGFWEGCRLAYHDFCWARKLNPHLYRVGNEQAWWFKEDV